MYRGSRRFTILSLPNCPPGKSGSCLCRSLCVPPWNPFLWCFLEGLCLHTSSCFGVSDAIRSLHMVCILPKTWGAPCSSSSLRWHGPMVETAIQLSSSLYMETQAGGLLPCILHHNHVPCALWPVWLPTEFLEAAWLGQKSSASWAQLSRGGAAAWTLCTRCSLWWALQQICSSFPQVIPYGHLCVFLYRDFQYPHEVARRES